MDVAYAIETESHVVFLLDARGICRGVTSPNHDSGAAARVLHAADACVGAQYVASIDIAAPGGLVHVPRPGAHLVFAVVAPDRTVSLVRTARALTCLTGADARAAAEAYAPPARHEDDIPSLSDLFNDDEDDEQMVTLRFETLLPVSQRTAPARIPPPPRLPAFEVVVPAPAAAPPESHVTTSSRGGERPTHPWGEGAYALSRRSPPPSVSASPASSTPTTRSRSTRPPAPVHVAAAAAPSPSRRRTASGTRARVTTEETKQQHAAGTKRRASRR